jgi:MbtH protein
MANPFESDTNNFLVLVNHEGQHSLWPSERAAPSGWEVVSGPETRENCLQWVNENWTDLRPLSLRANSANHG